MVRERLVFPQPDHFERESCLLKISLQLMEPFHDAMVDQAGALEVHHNAVALLEAQQSDLPPKGDPVRKDS